MEPPPTPRSVADVASEMSARTVHEAAQFLGDRVVRTPTLRSARLDEIVGAAVFLKAECMQHIGAFKARGAVVAVGRLSPSERERGVITFSSGNHAQAVALAAKTYGISCDVAMPEDAPSVKVDSVRRLGGIVTFAGTTSEERRLEAQAIAARTGGVIIQPFDHPDIIAGQGTATLELFEDAGELDALYVPVGGGGLIAGACLVAAERDTTLFAVEPEGCDAMGQSIERGDRVAVEPKTTLADGLKPVRVGALNFEIVRRHGVTPLRVDDEAIGRALTSLALHAHVIVEPSGAAALAGAIANQRSRGGQKHARIGVMLSGGNIGGAQLSNLLQRYPPLA